MEGIIRAYVEKSDWRCSPRKQDLEGLLADLDMLHVIKPHSHEFSPRADLCGPRVPNALFLCHLFHVPNTIGTDFIFRHTQNGSYSLLPHTKGNHFLSSPLTARAEVPRSLSRSFLPYTTAARWGVEAGQLVRLMDHGRSWA